MSELALKLIHEAKKTRATRLDLGNCGLTELPDELFELTWLEELILTNGYRIHAVKTAEEYKNPLYSLNIPNQLKILSPKLKLLRNLKKLDISGSSRDGIWKLNDLSPLKDLTQLQLLDVSCTQVSDLTPLKDLKQLQHLYVYSTQVSDLTPLKDLTQLQLLSVSLDPSERFNAFERLKAIATA